MRICKIEGGQRIRNATCKTGDEQRQGIALIMVLGFLTVLTIMAIGLAISVRTERMASNSYLDMVQARGCCEAALANSMQKMENILLDNKTPWQHIVAPNYSYYFPSGMASRFSVFTSMSTTNDYLQDSLLNGTATNFIPYYSEDFKGVFRPGAISDQARWVHVSLTNATVVTHGRYVYFAIDISGELDANYIGHTNETPYEIAVSALNEFGDISAYNKFKNKRDHDDIRYETVKDLRINGGQANPDRPYGLSTFSRFPPMRRINVDKKNKNITFGKLNSGWPVLLAENSGNWDMPAITNAFNAAIRNSAWRANTLPLETCDGTDLYYLLKDYVDNNCEPYDILDKPNVEPIPMINEIGINPGSKTMLVEVWEPFIGPNRYTGPFDIICTINGIPCPPIPSLNFVYGLDHTAPPPMVVDIPIVISNNTPVNIKFELRIDGEGTVDSVDFQNANLLDFSYQCDDPRFNHLPSQWTNLPIAEATLGDINVNVVTYDDEGTTAEFGDKDGDYLMYCANQDLRCVGELGYLPVAPWRTLKLYEDPRDGNYYDDMDLVLDYFTMQRTNEVKRGLINPNSPFPNPRKCALGITTENYPHKGLGFYIDQTTRDGSGILYNYLLNQSGVLSGQFRTASNVVVNLSDAGKKLYDAHLLSTKNRDPINLSELKLEDPMRRASQLFNIRQNAMIVCVWGQALSDERDTNGKFIVKAEAQAVALVWRDPYPVSDKNQHHRKLVRYMRWLE